MIEINRDTTTRNWRVLIPLDLWDDFEIYGDEVRLLMRRQETNSEGVMIVIPGGYTPASLREIIGHFFDGIDEISINN